MPRYNICILLNNNTDTLCHIIYQDIIFVFNKIIIILMLKKNMMFLMW